MESTNNKIKILVVDDDSNLNNVLVDKLNISGFEAEGVLDGEIGLKRALEFHPDVILLDLVMPKIDGFEVLKRLREDSWGKGAKVIMLTLIDRMDSIAQAVDKNVAGYLVKTNFSLDEIVEEVKKIIKFPKS